MSFAVFGPGVLMVTRTDTPSPLSLNIGSATEFQFAIKGTNKQLFGQNQFPIAAARGTMKATGKAKSAVISGQALNAIFFGGNFTAGTDGYYLNEAHTPAGTTQAVTNVTGGITDLGVVYALTGIPLLRVAAGSEVAGAYSVNTSTGVYTFASADEVPLLFNYTNFSALSGGQQLNVNNQLIGSAPTFQVDYWTNLKQPQAKPFGIRLYACVSNSLSMAFKQEDFMMPDLDFDCFSNPAGQLFKFNLPDLS